MSGLIETRERIEVAGISNEEEKILFEGYGFNELVDAAAEAIGTVSREEGRISVSLKHDVVWDTKADPTDVLFERDRARLQLVARSAMYIAAETKLANGDNPVDLTIAMKKLGSEAAFVTNPTPGYWNENAKFPIGPISLLETMSRDPEELLEKADFQKGGRKWIYSTAAASAVVTACSTATEQPPAIVTPAATDVMIQTPFVTETSTVEPTPAVGVVPDKLLRQQEELRLRGYTFRDGEIFSTDEQGTEWSVAKFNPDGSATIKALDGSYRGMDATLSADEVARMETVSLNAGSDELLVIKDKDTGKAEKIFLPNSDKSAATEAGWVSPLEISTDYNNPTRINSAAAVHSRHFLYSLMLDNGAEPFPADTPSTRFELFATTQYAGQTKISNIEINFPLANKDDGTEIYSQPRPIGYATLDTPQGQIFISALQLKINSSGESRILSIGYSGDALKLPEFIPNDVNKYRPLMIYQSIGDENPINFWVGGIQNMPGVEWLYYNDDPDNQPYKLPEFQDDIQWINSYDNEQLKRELFKYRFYEDGNKPGSEVITDTDVLDKLQQYILYPRF